MACRWVRQGCIISFDSALSCLGAGANPLLEWTAVGRAEAEREEADRDKGKAAGRDEQVGSPHK